MSKDQLDALIASVKGIWGAAWCDRSGVVSHQSSGFDADVPCAVAAISSGQLEELGQALGAGTLVEWSMTTQETNFYVLHRDNASLVALGEPDDKAPAVAEKIAGAIANVAQADEEAGSSPLGSRW